MARSLAWPLPVKASEPCSDTEMRAGFIPVSRRPCRKRPAATIGPIVCEDEGPIPILKISKTLMNK